MTHQLFWFKGWWFSFGGGWFSKPLDLYFGDATGCRTYTNECRGLCLSIEMKTNDKTSEELHGKFYKSVFIKLFQIYIYISNKILYKSFFCRLKYFRNGTTNSINRILNRMLNYPHGLYSTMPPQYHDMWFSQFAVRICFFFCF